MVVLKLSGKQMLLLTNVTFSGAKLMTKRPAKSEIN